MKRSWISLAILLAAISMVNASPFYVYKRDGLGHLHKRAIALVPCKEASKIVLTGSVDPDPVPGTPAKATLSFTTAEDAPKLFLTTSVLEDGAAKAADVTTADLCTAGLKCPEAKGKGIEITTTTDIPKEVKAPFSIEYNINDGAKTIACGVAVAKAADGGAPKDGAPKDGAPKDGAPKDGDAPKDGAPKDAPKDGAPDGDGAPKDGAPKDGAPKDGGGGGGGGDPAAPGDGGGDGGDGKRRK